MKKLLVTSFATLAVSCSAVFAEIAETADISAMRTECQKQEKVMIGDGDYKDFPSKLWYEPAKLCVPFRPCYNGKDNPSVKHNFCNDKDYLTYTIKGVGELNGIARYLCGEEDLLTDVSNAQILPNKNRTTTSVTFRCKNNKYFEIYTSGETASWANLNSTPKFEDYGPRFCKQIGGTWGELGESKYKCEGLSKYDCKRFGYYVDSVAIKYTTEYVNNVCQVLHKPAK